MKIATQVRLLGITFLVFVFLCGSSQKASAASVSFSRTLTLGSYGEDVRGMQKILNQDSATRIADTGPGSPGNETSYFGPATKAAVIRFQTKYTNEVLTPAGLTAGSGYVGSYTRAKLSTLSALADTVVTPTPITSPVNPSPVATSVAAPSAARVQSSQNPNLKNIDKVFAILDNIAIQQNISSTTLATEKAAVLKRLATTTDLRAAFLKKVQQGSHQSLQTDSFIGKIVTTIKQAFYKAFMPEHALAQEEVAAPFGGLIVASFPCDGDVWNVYLEPLPPTYAVALSYIGGSQAFLSYDAPIEGTYLLGEYEPIPMAYCWEVDVPIPTEGMITPFLGSSPL